MMRVYSIEMNVIAGQPEVNYYEILKQLNKIGDSADLVVLPETCISGYMVGDLWEEFEFIQDCIYFGQQLVEYTRGVKYVLAFGNIFLGDGLTGEDGRPRKYNGIWICKQGQLLYKQPKVLLPNYREFDEGRYFHDARKLAVEQDVDLSTLLWTGEINGIQTGFLLCEDGWDTDYHTKPVDILIEKGVKFIINISASPYTKGKTDKRSKVFSAMSSRFGIPVLYVNQTGVQNNGKNIFVFDGGTTMFVPNGQIAVPESSSDIINMYDVEEDLGYMSTEDRPTESPDAQFDAIMDATKFMVESIKPKSVVIGLSGGIDSAAVALAFSVIQKKTDFKFELILVNMPSEHNSKTTIGISDLIAQELKRYSEFVGYVSIPIDDSVALTINQLNGNAAIQLSSFDLENVQARDRSSRILAAVAAATQGVFTNNGNKSEITVSYATLYGDVCGFVSILGDLWKSEVYDFCRYLEDLSEAKLPPEIYTLSPSAELSGTQNVDNGGKDPLIYGFDDHIMSLWVENWNRYGLYETLCDYQKGIFDSLIPENFASEGEKTKVFINRIESLWDKYKGIALAKRIQSPPIIAVKRRAFGFDLRESQFCNYKSIKYQTLKTRLLSN